MIKKLFLAIGLLSILASPVMASTNFPNDFPGGLTVRGMPILNSYPGSIWWVSASGSDGNRGNFDQPFGTLDYAIGRCSANKGDIILVKPGYIGTVSSAGGIDMDVAGIAIIGLGAGSDMPKLQWGSSTADIDVDAANITLKNFYLDARGYATVTTMIDVNSHHFTIEDCEFNMGSSTLTAIDVGNSATATTCLRLVCKTQEAGAGSFIHLGGTASSFYAEGLWVDGSFGSSCVFNPSTTNMNGMVIKDCLLRNSKTGTIPLDLNGSGTGFLIDNKYISDVALASSVDPGACASFNCFHGRWNDVTGTLTPSLVSP
jgi:hypothetical protein